MDLVLAIGMSPRIICGLIPLSVSMIFELFFSEAFVISSFLSSWALPLNDSFISLNALAFPSASSMEDCFLPSASFT